MIKGGVILWFIWQLDVLLRRRPVERPARFLQSGPDRPPTRPGLPDYGEFGRFDLSTALHVNLYLAGISAPEWFAAMRGREVCGHGSRAARQTTALAFAPSSSTAMRTTLSIRRTLQTSWGRPRKARASSARRLDIPRSVRIAAW